MPVRDGRWVSWSSIIAAEKAEAGEVEEPAGPAPKPQGRVHRIGRNKAAAEAAIAASTGKVVSLDDLLAEPTPITPLEGAPE
jgi:hypothetical protein